MKEIQLQKLVIDALRDNGGAGHKLSSRFLIGVSDLLIKHPARPAALYEVKLNKFAASGLDDHVFKLDVTVPQQDFLRKYHNAGMPVGVLSGVMRGTKLYLCCYPFLEVEALSYVAKVSDHVDMGRGDERKQFIFKYIGSCL